MSTTRQKLIDTAFDLFGRGGFHGVGIDQIIAQAGVSKQTFYNHFESKDELVLAVLHYRHQVESQNFVRIVTELAGQDPRARLYVLCEALERWFALPEWRGCIFITAAAEFPLEHDPAHQAACEHVLGLRDQIQYMATLAGAASPRELASQLALLMEGILIYRHITGETGTVAMAKEIARRLIDAQFQSQAVGASAGERVGAAPMLAGLATLEMAGQVLLACW